MRIRYSFQCVYHIENGTVYQIAPWIPMCIPLHAGVCVCVCVCLQEFEGEQVERVEKARLDSGP